VISLEFIDLITKYGPTIGPYLGIYLLTQAIKNTFKLKNGSVFIMVFIVSCAVAFAQINLEKTLLTLKELYSMVLLRGLSLSAMSWLTWWFIKRLSKKQVV
jgi:hypothetical protein